MDHSEYILDFVIPAGKRGTTGANGLPGKQGPTGPTSQEDLIYNQYNNSFTTGLLNIFKTIILPDDSLCFSVNNNEITINKPGNYEYTLCGKINGSANLNIQVIDENSKLDNIASISSVKEATLFSKSGILKITSKQKIRLYFFANATNANVEPLKFIIKRLPF